MRGGSQEIGDTFPFPPKKNKEYKRQVSGGQSDDALYASSPTPKVKPNPKLASMRKNLLKELSDVFKEDLCKDDFITEKEIKIEVKDDADIKPLNVMTPTSIPVHLLKAADLELKKCLAAGVLEPVEHSTQWCSR